MNTRKFFLSLLLLILQAIGAKAQHFSIFGEVTDGHQPVAGAQVFLLHPEQMLLGDAFTDDSGHFEIKGLSESPCQLKIALPGYEVFTSEVLSLKQSITYKTIVLSVKNGGLKEVTVSARKPVIRADADKLVLNVGSSITSQGSNVLEVLQQAPNVQVDQNDNIALKGKQGVTVYIDGRQAPVQGEDLAALLKSMPASSVDKIELINHPGTRYDAAGAGGVIHIKTKKERRKGWNGVITGNYHQGETGKYNAGLSLNYRQDKVSAYLNYNGGKRHVMNDMDMHRRFISDTGNDTIYQQLILPKVANTSHSLTAGMDYSWNNKSTLGLVFSGGLNQITNKSRSTTKVKAADDQPLYHIGNNTDIAESRDNHAVNFNFAQTLNEGKKLTVNADYARYFNKNNQQLHTRITGADGTPRAPEMVLWGDMNGYTDIRTLKADYEQTLNEKTKLEAGAKTGFVTADNAPTFYNNNGGGKSYDGDKSNHFVYSENISAAYVNISREWNKWSLLAGVRTEHTRVDGHEKTLDTTFTKQYLNLFPNLSLAHQWSEDSRFALTLTRRLERPTYQELNPFRIFLDQSSIKQGNPELNPSLSWTVALSHIFKNRFTTTLEYGWTAAPMAQVIKPGLAPDGGKQTLITLENLDVNKYYSISGAYPLQVTKWWNSTNTITAYYNRYEGNLQGSLLSKGRAVCYLSSTNTFTLPRQFSVEVSGWYHSPQLYGYMDLNTMYAINAGIQKQFWNRKASIKLSVNDIFRSMSPSGASTFATYREDFVLTRDTRTIGLSFSYHFGNNKIGSVRRNKSGAAEEMQRVGGERG